MVFLANLVVPKIDGHGWESCSANQFSRFRIHGIAIIVKYLDLHAEARGLNFTTPNWQNWHTSHEARNNICAATNGGQMYVNFDFFVDVIKTLR